MAMESIDDHLKIRYGHQLHVRAQQMKSRLRDWCEIQPVDGDAFAYDGIGDVEARELTVRFSDTVFSDIDHNRRKLSPREFEITLPIDQNDIEGTLLDPRSAYVDACVRAMERVFDRVVYDAMFADVLTGKDFTETVTASSDGVLTVDMTAGVTLAKILSLHENFIDNEVGNDIPATFGWGIAGGEHTAMLQIQQLTEGLYTQQLPVEDGQINKAAGIQLIKFGASARIPVLTVTAGTRKSFCMVKEAMFVGITRAPQIKIQERTDKVNTSQVQITFKLGAVRKEGKLLQQVNTTA